MIVAGFSISDGENLERGKVNMLRNEQANVV